MSAYPRPSPEIRMASVAKLDNGYARIANELLEAMAASPFTLRQVRVLIAVARFTYGYQKRTSLISTKKIAEVCNLPGCHARKAIADLLDAKVLFREGGQKGKIGINNHVEQWIFATETVANTTRGFATETVANSATETVANSATETVANPPTTPFSIKKNNKEEEEIGEKPSSSPPENLIGPAERIAAAWNRERPNLAITPILPPKRRENILKTLEFVESNVGNVGWPIDKTDIPSWFAALFRYFGNHQGYLRDRDFGFFMDPDRLTDVVEEGDNYGSRK